jgi:hypothetical protein
MGRRGWGARLGKLGKLRSNNLQTALVATLDTYDFNLLPDNANIVVIFRFPIVVAVSTTKCDFLMQILSICCQTMQI